MGRRHLRAVPAQTATTRVLVVDDHALFAEALVLTLAIEERIAWVVIVTASRSAQAAAHALAAGAGGYLTKDTPALQLIDTILSRRSPAIARTA